MDSLLPVHLNPVDLRLALAWLGGAALSLGRVVGRARQRRLLAGLDLGFALFTLEPVVLIPETLDLVPQLAVLRRQLFDQVQKTDDRATCTFEVLNVIRVKVFEYHIRPSDRDEV
jgi:hypothetical protein